MPYYCISFQNSTQVKFASQVQAQEFSHTEATGALVCSTCQWQFCLDPRNARAYILTCWWWCWTFHLATNKARFWFQWCQSTHGYQWQAKMSDVCQGLPLCNTVSMFCLSLGFQDIQTRSDKIWLILRIDSWRKIECAISECVCRVARFQSHVCDTNAHQSSCFQQHRERE